MGPTELPRGLSQAGPYFRDIRQIQPLLENVLLHQIPPDPSDADQELRGGPRGLVDGSPDRISLFELV